MIFPSEVICACIGKIICSGCIDIWVQQKKHDPPSQGTTETGVLGRAQTQWNREHVEGVGVNKAGGSAETGLGCLRLARAPDLSLRNTVMGMVGPKEEKEEGLNVCVCCGAGSRGSRGTWKEHLSPQCSVFLQLPPPTLRNPS